MKRIIFLLILKLYKWLKKRSNFTQQYFWSKIWEEKFLVDLDFMKDNKKKNKLDGDEKKKYDSW